MRWSIIRLIFMRDLRDQLRDRRTVLMIALLPLVLYPVLGLAAMQFAFSFGEKPSVIGVVGKPDDFPPRSPTEGSSHPVSIVSWFACLPSAPGGPPLRIDSLLGAAALSETSRRQLEYPLLVKNGRFPKRFFNLPGVGKNKRGASSHSQLQVVFLGSDQREPLDSKEVDLILSASDSFWKSVDQTGAVPPFLKIQTRPDDRSRQANNRLYLVLAMWKQQLKEARLLRQGLPAHFDDPVFVWDVERMKPLADQASEGLFDLMVKIFPFMLVMWALAGALYPAVDLCAGEKERGTMETLIISPASREEIVLGKFLTIWFFSLGTSILNLLSMTLTAWQFSSQLLGEPLKPWRLLWCLTLLVPLSAFFSAICLSIGAYARSSKEGQYYLMPLFLVTMPLVFLTLAPGVELNPFYSLVPVTGVALLMQRLMAMASIDAGTWFYFLPVLAPIVLYSWLALRWAIEQFKREEVLFREAERLDIKLWLRHLFRDREALPSTGQVVFCIGLILALRWLSLGLGRALDPLVHLSIELLAFVGTPAVVMALQLTTRPRRSLALNRVQAKTLATPLLLAAAVLIPLVQLTLVVYDQLDQIKHLVAEHEATINIFDSLSQGKESTFWVVLALIILPALCEEVAFRGFILSGLRRRFHPWTAVGLSSFAFAIYHMNVFQFLPTFLLGGILAILTIRFGSIYPAIFFHLLHNTLLVSGAWLQGYADQMGFDPGTLRTARYTITALCTMLALLLLWRLALRKPLPGAEALLPPE